MRGIKDLDGNLIVNASVDIPQTAPNALYSSQDPEQDTYSFHGIIRTDETGRYAFTTVRPVPYTVLTDGPVGRSWTRRGGIPGAPVTFISSLSGWFQAVVTEVFPDDDLYLDQDTVFGVWLI